MADALEQREFGSLQPPQQALPDFSAKSPTMFYPAQLVQKLSAREVQLAEATSMIDKYLENMERLRQVHEKLVREHEVLKEQHQTQTKELRKAQESLRGCQKQFAEYRAGNEVTVCQLQENIETLKEAARSQEDIHVLRLQIAEELAEPYEADITRLVNDKEALLEQIGGLQGQIKDLQEEMIKAKSMHKDEMQDLKLLQDGTNRLSAENDVLRCQVAQYEKEISQKDDKLQGLEQQMREKDKYFAEETDRMIKEHNNYSRAMTAAKNEAELLAQKCEKNFQFNEERILRRAKELKEKYRKCLHRLELMQKERDEAVKICVKNKEKYEKWMGEMTNYNSIFKANDLHLNEILNINASHPL